MLQDQTGEKEIKVTEEGMGLCICFIGFSSFDSTVAMSYQLPPFPFT